MTLKTRLYMSILYLIHKKKPLTLDNILETGGMDRNLAPTIVHNLEVRALVNQLTTEMEGVDMKIESLGLDRETVIPIKFVPKRSKQELDLIDGYVEVDHEKYEKIVLELIADLPSIDICSQWESIKQEGRYDHAITHDMMNKMSQYHPMIVLNSIEYYYKPDNTLYDYLLSRIIVTSQDWDQYFKKLMDSLSKLVKQKYPQVRSFGFSTFSEIREIDMAHWIKSEFIPEFIKFFIRTDIPSGKWLIEVCDEKGNKCMRVEIKKDLSDMEKGLQRIREL